MAVVVAFLTLVLVLSVLVERAARREAEQQRAGDARLRRELRRHD